MGRKSKYESCVKPKLETITGWARDGLTEEQICKNLNVGVTAFNDYKKKYEELIEALKRGRDDAVYEVENALFKSACGFYYTEEEITKSGQIVQLTKYAKPNTSAQIFFLKNKRPDEWKDKREYQAEVTTSVMFEGEDDIKE